MLIQIGSKVRVCNVTLTADTDPTINATLVNCLGRIGKVKERIASSRHPWLVEFTDDAKPRTFEFSSDELSVFGSEP